MNEITDLMDGVKLPVSFKAKPGETPKTAEIFVRRIPICDMEGLSKAWGKPKFEVAIYCDQPLQWVETLSEDSFIEVMDKGRQLNFTSYAKWFGWQMQTMQALGQGDAMGEIMKEVTAKAKEIASQAVSQVSPPPSNS